MGGRLASWALAAAFAVVVALAAADAVRNRGGETRAEGPERARVIERLRSAQVHGTLVLTAPGGCARAAWSLPTLEPAGEDGLGCRVSGRVQARRPDGLLTELDGGGVVLVLPDCASVYCRRPLVPRGRLERAGRLHPRVPARPARVRVLVDGLAWLTNRRGAALLSFRVAGRPDLRGSQAVAFFEDGHLVAVHALFRGDVRGLRARPGGRYVAAAPGVVVRGDGSGVSLPGNLVNARGVAWSPDGRWLALSLRASVVLVATASLERHDRTGSGLRTIDLPLEAGGLEWR